MQLKDEISRVTATFDRERAKLQAELESLKAQLFESQQSSASTKPSHRQKRSGNHTGEEGEVDGADAPQAGPSGSAAESETIAKLQREIESQENLISGLQRENERLYAIEKEKEALQRSIKANFFDQHEALNKELNRLRNLVGETDGGGENIQSSYNIGSRLRNELDTDATIRALRERVAVAESTAGIREKELQQTIEKLRVENRELIERSKSIRNQVMAELSAQQENLVHEKKVAMDELKELREKLIWYAENQELLEQIESEKQDLSGKLANIKSCLRTKYNFSLATINQMMLTTSSATDGPTDNAILNDTSLLDHDTSLGHMNKRRRSPADIKRIK